MKHENNGNCLRCRRIIGKFPGFHQELAKWFVEFQAAHPEAHCSEAGRDEDTQEAFYRKRVNGKRVSKARWTMSAHNWNAAMDIFEQSGASDIYEVDWFASVLRPALPDWIEWYGRPGSGFFELPHIEVKDWKLLVSQGKLRLVGSDDTNS